MVPDRATQDDETGISVAPTDAGDLQDDESERLRNLIADLPEEERRQILKAAGRLTSLEATFSAFFSGPLPPPSYFEEYERILPGSAQAILDMAKEEQKITTESLRGPLANERLKTWGAIWIGTGMLAVAAYATYLGNAVIAVPLGLAGIASFLLRQYGKRRSGE